MRKREKEVGMTGKATWSWSEGGRRERDRNWREEGRKEGRADNDGWNTEKLKE